MLPADRIRRTIVEYKSVNLCQVSIITQLNASATISHFTMAEEKFNVDELVAPSFITEAYIVDILRQAEDDPELHVKDTCSQCSDWQMY